MSQAELRVVSGKHSGSSIPLPTGKFLVGREEDCHLRPNSDLVSRHHCVFILDDYGLRLRDLGSTNGSFVNGERLQGSVILNTGDQVTIGKLEFEVAIGDDLSEDTQTNLAASAQTEVITNNPEEQGAEDQSTAKAPDDSELMNELLDNIDEPATDEAEPNSSDTMINIPTQPVPPGFEGQPQPQTGDTQYFPPGMPPQGYPQQMAYPPQMMYGYPGYPQMPYPQQPVAYPPGYPQQQYPQQPAPQQPAEEATGGDSEELAVRLPDPSQTGIKVPEPKPEPEQKPGDDNRTAEAKAKEEAPSAAADAIQQYLQRRPGGSK